MKKNVGKVDRSLRIFLAIALIVLIMTDVIAGTWAWVAGVVVLAALFTSFVSWCPLFVPFGISTVGKSKD